MRPLLLQDVVSYIEDAAMETGWHSTRTYVDRDTEQLRFHAAVPLEVLAEKLEARRILGLRLPNLDAELQKLLKRRATGGLWRYGRR